jgi:hypothetical protein
MQHLPEDVYQTKIFISCSGKDIDLAHKLERDLKNQHVSPWIYKKCIRLGHMWLKEIDEALAEADYV